MSLFGSIASRIFGHHEAAAATPDKPNPAASGGPAQASTFTGKPPAGSATTATPTAPGSGAPPQQPVDVAAVLTTLAASKPEQLDWRHSIVDLLKVLDLDSSFVARKQLAQELHFSGDTNDSASMNIWLHHEVMVKLAENGGKVPEDSKA